MTDYTTATAFATWADFDSDFDSDHQDHELIGTLISAASIAIDDYCDRQFIEDSDNAVSRVFTASNWQSPFDGNLLLLDKDLCNVISIDGDSDLATADWGYLPSNESPYWGIIRKTGSWSSITVGVSVVGTWAYSVAPPEPIIYATKRLAKWLYDQRSMTPGDAIVVTPEGHALVPARLPPDVIALLQPYKRLRYA